MPSQEPQVIVENNDWVFSFYKVKEVQDLNWNTIQVKELCRKKTIADVNKEIEKLNNLRTKRIEEHTKWLANIDRDIAKQQQFLSLMI